MPKAVDKSAIHLKIAFTSIAFMPSHRFCFIDEGQLRAWEASLHSVGKLKQESEAPEQSPSEKESVQQAFAEHLLNALDSASRSSQSGREKKNSQQGRQTGVLGWKEPGGDYSFSWISAIPCGNQDGSLNDGIRIGGGKDVYGRDSVLQQGLAWSPDLSDSSASWPSKDSCAGARHQTDAGAGRAQGTWGGASLGPSLRTGQAAGLRVAPEPGRARGCGDGLMGRATVGQVVGSFGGPIRLWPSWETLISVPGLKTSSCPSPAGVG